jgi:hypothetical protein
MVTRLHASLTPPRPCRLPPPHLPLSQLLGRTRPLLLPTDVGQYDAFQYVAAAGSRQVCYLRHTGVPPPLRAPLHDGW